MFVHVVLPTPSRCTLSIPQSEPLGEELPDSLPLPAQSFSNLLTTKVPSELVPKVAFVPLSINHPIHPGLRLNQKKSLPACTPTVYLIVGIPPMTEPVAIIL